MFPLLVAVIHSIFGIMCANIIMESMSVTSNMTSILGGGITYFNYIWGIFLSYLFDKQANYK